MTRRLSLETRSIHGRLDDTEIPSEPIGPPLFQTASFAFESMEAMDEVIGDSTKGFAYSRLKNPTVDLLERTIADLETGEAGVAFASGMAAIHAAVTSIVASGDHIVAPRTLYGGTHALFTHVFPRFEIGVSFVPNGDLEAFRRAIRPRTKLVYAETITNPTLEVSDLPALAEIAHGQGLPLFVDSTLASPALCRPLELGADAVIHSASKYLGGHGDLIAGLVATNKDLARGMRKTNLLVGGSCAPFVAWLILRGLKTLGPRMTAHSANALEVARHLEQTEAAHAVRYPGLPSHETHSRAADLLERGFGGMVSFELPGGLAAAKRFCDALQVFKRAGSLGDTHSLALLPAMASHRSFSASELAAAGMSPGFIRLSIGLESVEDLKSDLDQAFAALHR